MPFFALWAHKDAGIPIEFIGLLLGCYAGGELLATPFLGGIADRIGRRPVLLVSTSGVGLGFLGLYFVHGAVAAAAVLLAIGVFESVLHPTAGTVIADVVPAETRRAHFALRRVMSNAGGMAGPALGALLALHSLRLVFIGAAVTLLTGAVVVAIFLRETRPQSVHPDDDEDELASRVYGGISRFASCRPAAAGRSDGNRRELDPSDDAALCRRRRHADRLGHRIAVRLCRRARRGAAIAGDAGKFAHERICDCAVERRMQAIAFTFLFVSPAVASLVAAVTLLALSQMLYGPLVQTVVAELAPKTAQATYQAAFSRGV